MKYNGVNFVIVVDAVAGKEGVYCRIQISFKLCKSAYLAVKVEYAVEIGMMD